MRILCLFLLPALLLAGCRKEEEGALAPRLEPEIRRHFSTPKGSAEILPSPPPTPAVIIPAPDPVSVGDARHLAEATQEASGAINVKVLEKRFDPARIYITLLLQNVTDKGVRTRLFILGYDRNDRMVTAVDSALYFNPREQMVQNFNFERVAGMTRWVITAR